MRQSHLIASNAVILWSTRILSLLPQLALVPYLIRTIGESGYGVYALIWSLLMSIDQLERSLQSGVVKYCAGFFAQGDKKSVNNIASSSLVYSLVLAVLACGGVLIVSMLYKDTTGKITLALLLTGILLLFVVPLTPYIAIIQSRQRYYVAAISDVLSKYIGISVIYLWFTVFTPSVEALIVILMVMLFLSRLVQVPMAYKLVPGLRVTPRLFEQKSLRQIALFGTSTVLASICIALNSTGIRWLMNSLESISFVTHLAIMLMPGLILSYLIGAMVITIMPATSAYSAMNNQLMLQELMVKGMKYISIFVLTALLGFGFMIKPIFIFWLGHEYELLIPYTLAILTSLAFMESTSVSHHMLKGLGRLKAVVYIYFIGLVLIPFPTILIVFRLSSDPYLSVTLGLVAGNLVAGFTQTIVCARQLNIRPRIILLQVFAQPLLIAVIVAIFAYYIEHHISAGSLISQIAISTLAMILFLTVCYTTITSPKEKEWIKKSFEILKVKALSFVRK